MATVRGGTAYKEALRKITREMKKAKVRVGFPVGATYPNGTPIGMVAAIQNYGAPRAGIPPRPFFSNMIRDSQSTWPTIITANLKATNYNVMLTMDRLGEAMAFQLKQSIINMNAPALSPVTVMLRGMRANDSSLVVTGKTVGEAAQRVRDGKTNYGASEKPLVDNGDMLAAVVAQVTT